MAETALKEGVAAPEFSLPSSLGRNISLKDYRGKKIILYFTLKMIPPVAPKKPVVSEMT